LAIHTKAELHALIDALPDSRIAEGIVITEPRRARRLQAESRKKFTLSWPESHHGRFVRAINAMFERNDGDLAREKLCRAVERAVAEDTEDAHGHCVA
jgi:hypothetical protein